jgi:hypothetical protein
MTDFMNPSPQSQRSLSAWLKYMEECLLLDKAAYKKLKLCAIVSVVLPLFMYRTCICFFNEDISYYNYLLGFGVNTCVTRYLQLK